MRTAAYMRIPQNSAVKNVLPNDTASLSSIIVTARAITCGRQYRIAVPARPVPIQFPARQTAVVMIYGWL